MKVKAGSQAIDVRIGQLVTVVRLLPDREWVLVVNQDGRRWQQKVIFLEEPSRDLLRYVEWMRRRKVAEGRRLEGVQRRHEERRRRMADRVSRRGCGDQEPSFGRRFFPGLCVA